MSRRNPPGGGGEVLGGFAIAQPGQGNAAAPRRCRRPVQLLLLDFALLALEDVVLHRFQPREQVVRLLQSASVEGLPYLVLQPDDLGLILRIGCRLGFQLSNLGGDFDQTG